MSTQPLADARYGWVWAVLPADCARARTVGDAQLAATLRAAGITGSGDGGGGSEATVLAVGRRPSPAQLDAVISRREPGEVVVVALVAPVGAAAERPGRARRGLDVLASFPRGLATAMRARAVLRRLRRAGLEASSFSVGETSRGHVLGRRGELLRRRGLPTGALVTGRPPGARRLLLAEALAGAARTAPHPLERLSVEVLSTGAVMVELDAGGSERYLLRVAAGPAGGLLERSLETVALLSTLDPPDTVRERILAPVARGRVGPAVWTFEPKVPGTNPATVDPRLWDEVLEFLLGLQALGEGPVHAGSPGSDALEGWSLEADVEAVEPHLPAGERGMLRGLVARLGPPLGGVPRGWAHGDLSPGNLVVDAGRLCRVLDWDSAAPRSVPTFDLLHLDALSTPDRRRLAHGSRVTEVLWPMACKGGDEPTRRWCRAVGMAPDPRALRSLTFGYWLSRVARDLRTYADRPSRRAWMDANVHRPLGELERARG